MTKRIVSIVLALIMALSVIPAVASAKTLDCELEAHSHEDACYKLICEDVAEDHEHAEACYELECELEVHEHEDACYVMEASKLVTNINELTFFVGEAQEFTFETIANDDAGVMVIGSSNFDDESAIAKLEYFEVQNGEWYELTGDFGPAAGFPMGDAVSKFRVTFAKAGEYTFTAVMKNAETGDVLCSVESTAIVAENYAITDGADAEWDDKSNEGLMFTSDAPFAKFVGVMVDNKIVDEANFVAEEGSTIVALKANFLKSLEAGKHTLDIVSEDGIASTEFTVVHEHVMNKIEAKESTCVENGNKAYYVCRCGKWFDIDTAEEITDKKSVELKLEGHDPASAWSRDHKSHWHKCTVCGEPADEKVEHDFNKEGKICKTCKYDVDDPQTGDEFNIVLMVTLMAMSVMGIAVVSFTAIRGKKSK